MNPARLKRQSARICKQCGKRAELRSIQKLPALKRQRLLWVCGHSELEPLASHPENRDLLWKALRPYQQDGVEFIEGSSFRALIGDEMGLGKTPQSLMALRYNKAKLTPCLIVCKASLMYNWAKECLFWLGSVNGEPPEGEPWKTAIDPQWTPFLILDSGIKPLPGFPIYIISQDLLRKKINELESLGLQTIIIDESHNFANPEAKRTQALIKFSQKIPNRLCLSGTAVVNRASEYFTTLNLIKPEVWYNRAAYIRNWLFINSKGQPGGIASHLRERFHEVTADYIIRRKRSEVLTELPPFQRYFTFVDITDPNFVRVYRQGQKELSEFLKRMYDLDPLARFQHILALLAKLRHLCGVAKVPHAAEFVRDYLSSQENGSKITVGVHHRDVALLLGEHLKEFKPLFLSGGLSKTERFSVENDFRNDKNCKVLIASTLAAGEGINLQFCHTVLQVERQWNCAKEVQFEGRFHRFGQLNPVLCTYLLAKGSIDEWLTQLIIEKSNYKDSALEQMYGKGENDFSVDYVDLARKVADQQI